MATIQRSGLAQGAIAAFWRPPHLCPPIWRSASPWRLCRRSLAGTRFRAAGTCSTSAPAGGKRPTDSLALGADRGGLCCSAATVSSGRAGGAVRKLRRCRPDGVDGLAASRQAAALRYWAGLRFLWCAAGHPGARQPGGRCRSRVAVDSWASGSLYCAGLAVARTVRRAGGGRIVLPSTCTPPATLAAGARLPDRLWLADRLQRLYLAAAGCFAGACLDIRLRESSGGRLPGLGLRQRADHAVYAGGRRDHRGRRRRHHDVPDVQRRAKRRAVRVHVAC